MEEVKSLGKHISNVVRTRAQPSASTSFPEDLETGDLQHRITGSSRSTWHRIAASLGKDTAEVKGLVTTLLDWPWPFALLLQDHQLMLLESLTGKNRTSRTKSLHLDSNKGLKPGFQVRLSNIWISLKLSFRWMLPAFPSAEILFNTKAGSHHLIQNENYNTKVTR